MKGIVLAGGSGTRLHPLTIGVSKQMLPVYDKPMIYYPLSVLMLAGIREILIISTPEHLGSFEKLLGDGSRFGLRLFYKIQERPEGLAQAFILGKEFIGSDDVCMVLGDNIFYGAGLQNILKSAVAIVQDKKQAVIFGANVKDPERYGVAEFDENSKVISIEEKPTIPKSNYAVVGLYFYPNSVVDVASKVEPSNRGELEITSVNQHFLNTGELSMELLGRGFAWLDTGTHEALSQATEFVKAVEVRTGLKIACLEEIALHQNWISKKELLLNIKDLKGDYYEYIRHDVL